MDLVAVTLPGYERAMSSLSLLDCEAVTAVGDCAAQVASSIRAGIQRQTGSSFIGLDGNPLVLASVPESWLPVLNVASLSPQHGRALRLLTLALAELDHRQALPPDAAIILVLPPFTSVGDEERFHQLMTQRMPGTSSPRRIEILTGDAVTGIQALVRAGEWLAAGASRVVIAAADSCGDPRQLLAVRPFPLRTTEAEGTVLGDGAVVLVIGPQVADTVVIAGVGVVDEPADLQERQPRLATALTAAIQLATAPAPAEPAAFVFSGSAGHPIEVIEYGLVTARLHPLLSNEARMIAARDHHGYLGPASALLGLAIAHGGYRRGWLSGHGLVIAYAHGQRAVCSLKLPATVPDDPAVRG
jgi:hypothetical protein